MSVLRLLPSAPRRYYYWRAVNSGGFNEHMSEESRHISAAIHTNAGVILGGGGGAGKREVRYQSRSGQTCENAGGNLARHSATHCRSLPQGRRKPKYGRQHLHPQSLWSNCLCASLRRSGTRKYRDSADEGKDRAL